MDMRSRVRASLKGEIEAQILTEAFGGIAQPTVDMFSRVNFSRSAGDERMDPPVPEETLRALREMSEQELANFADGITRLASGGSPRST